MQLFHHDIASKAEKFYININIDQAPTTDVPVGQSPLAKKVWTTAPIKGSSDKRTIRNFLPIQLTYAGFTAMSMKLVILSSRS